MKNKTIFIVIFIFLLLLTITLIFLLKNSGEKQNQVCFKNNCFLVELAVTLEEKGRGLMFREDLPIDNGMLFLYNKEEKHSFWMKNTLIPLDIIWISEDKKVVFISSNVQPCKEDYCPSIIPPENAKYVLEVNAGVAEKIGLAVGETVDIMF